MNKSFVIKVLNNDSTSEVNALRLEQYQTAKGFEVKAPGILWNKSDDESIILGVYDGELLVSTMRIEIIQDQALLEEKLECPWNFGREIEFPIMLLSKASTDKNYHSLGLNALLRDESLRLAQEWEVSCLIGTMIEGSPRVNSMKIMGYEFFRNELGWNTTNYKSLDPVLVSYLGRDKFSLAREVCQKIVSRGAISSRWEGHYPVFKTVSCVL